MIQNRRDNCPAVSAVGVSCSVALVCVLVLCASASASAAEAFDAAALGPINALTTSVGVWRSNGAAALIDHPRTRDRCLHLTGGEARSVELTPSHADAPSAELVFDAERWTSRDPFRFRVEAWSGGAWKPLYNGDQAIAVGGLTTRVRVPLGVTRMERLRITCSSPEGAGVLMDNVSLAPRGPMRATSVVVHHPTVPVLRGAASSPIFSFRIDAAGTDGELTLDSIELSTDGTTDPADIEHVEVSYTGPNDALNAPNAAGPLAKAVRFGPPRSAEAVGMFTGRQTLSPGANYFCVSVRLKPSADVDHRIALSCIAVHTSDRRRIEPQPDAEPRPAGRIGIALRQAGDDGARAYRIPGLVTTNAGTLIGVYDIRYDTGGDLPGNIDVGMSRSTDGGQTWEPMRTIMDMGHPDGKDPKWRSDGIGDPAVLVDRNTNTIWVAATWSHGDRSWVGSGPGLEPHETGQFMLVRSDDDGKSWSKPINITKQVKDPAWCFVLQGPGRGITMADGTLVFAAQYQDPPAAKRLPHSTIIYSKDRGETWHIGSGAFDDTTEAQVAELEPGVLMLNCRYNRQNRRVVMLTCDMGTTWTEHDTSRKAIAEPGTCMASLIRLDLPSHPGRWLAFSNPLVDAPPRRRMTIQLSSDFGSTWPERFRVLLDDGVSAGYSCVTQIDDKTIGILYEGSRAHMTFQRIRIDELIGDPDAHSPAAE